MGGQHQLEKGTSVSEDAGPQRGLDCEIPHRLGRRTKHFFMGVWKPLPSRRVLKTLRGSPKGKAQGGLKTLRGSPKGKAQGGFKDLERKSERKSPRRTIFARVGLGRYTRSGPWECF